MDDGRIVQRTGVVKTLFQPTFRPKTPCSRRRIPPILESLWVDQASQGLFRQSPELSARSGLEMRQWLVLSALACGSLMFAIWFPGWARQLFSLMAGALFLSLILIRLVASFTPVRWATRRSLPSKDLPQASIIIALYKEARVFPQLIEAIKAIDYPFDKLEVKLAIEADDGETLEAAKLAYLDERFEIIAVPPGEPRTKPRALNFALRFCRGEIITVHDAEDRPHPKQLRIAAESFADAGPDLACLQAPLNWYNRDDNWLTRQFSLEYAAHFHALLPLYSRLGWALPLGGTSNHFRASALRRARGWDAYNVTEDADLGFRLHALGYRCDLIQPMTLEEAPVRLWPWVCQRTRWLKGYAQTLAVHTRASDVTHKPGFIPALGLCLGASVVSALVHLPLILLCLYGFLTGEFSDVMRIAIPACLSAGYISAAVCARTGMQRAGLRARTTDLLTMPFYWPLQSFAALRALIQLVIAPYYWDKTEHGVSKTAHISCTSPSSRPGLPSASVLPFSDYQPGEHGRRSGRKRDHA